LKGHITVLLAQEGLQYTY